MPGGGESEEQAGEERDNEGEEEHRGIDGHFGDRQESGGQRAIDELDAPQRGEQSGLAAEIKSFWREFFTRAFHPYRPEQHYMRGPGPAWHAKYGTQANFRVKADFLD